ncbi:MAG: hypothetical protein JHD16_17950 [Solirubrobacteraceae bacterium]|nr:hypothetical protein [Solirubrobacteraceae bacterium]
MTRSLRTPAPTWALAVGALACTLSLASPAVAAQNQGGGKQPVRCEGKGGGNPGDKVTETVYRTVRGKVIHEAKWTYICGADGQWHTVLT